MPAPITVMLTDIALALLGMPQPPAATPPCAVMSAVSMSKLRSVKAVNGTLKVRVSKIRHGCGRVVRQVGT